MGEGNKSYLFIKLLIISVCISRIDKADLECFVSEIFLYFPPSQLTFRSKYYAENFDIYSFQKCRQIIFSELNFSSTKFSKSLV